MNPELICVLISRPFITHVCFELTNVPNSRRFRTHRHSELTSIPIFMRSDFSYFLDSRASYTSERSKTCTLNSRSFCVLVHKILTCVLYKCTMEINVGSPLTYFSDWCVSEVHVHSELTCVVNSRTFKIHVKLTNDINSRALRILCLCSYLIYVTSSRVF